MTVKFANKRTLDLFNLKTNRSELGPVDQAEITKYSRQILDTKILKLHRNYNEVKRGDSSLNQNPFNKQQNNQVKEPEWVSLSELLTTQLEDIGSQVFEIDNERNGVKPNVRRSSVLD